MLRLRYSCKERVWLCTHFSYILSCWVHGTFCIHGKPLPFLIEWYCKEKNNNNNKKTTVELKEGKSLKVVGPVRGLGNLQIMWSLKPLCEYQEYSLVFFIMIIIFTIYYVRNVYSLPKFLCWSLKCHYNGIWRYVVVEHLGGHEGGVLMNVGLRRDLGETISVFPHKRTQLKVTFVQTRKKILTWIQLTGT